MSTGPVNVIVGIAFSLCAAGWTKNAVCNLYKQHGIMTNELDKAEQAEFKNKAKLAKLFVLSKDEFIINKKNQAEFNKLIGRIKRDDILTCGIRKGDITYKQAIDSLEEDIRSKHFFINGAFDIKKYNKKALAALKTLKW